MTFEESERRVALFKKWQKKKFMQTVADFHKIRSITTSQTQALEELRRESEDLYQAAIQVI